MQIAPIVGLIMHQESARLLVRSVITATNKGHFSKFCHSRQHGKSPESSVRSSSQNNTYSHHDVHEIDQSQFDDSVQFEQDSITIQFKTQIDPNRAYQCDVR